MYRTKSDEILMLWSTFIKGNYAECLVKFDGGHGMVFADENNLYLTFHKSGFEKPRFVEIEDMGCTVSLKQSI